MRLISVLGASLLFCSTTINSVTPEQELEQIMIDDPIFEGYIKTFTKLQEVNLDIQRAELLLELLDSQEKESTDKQLKKLHLKNAKERNNLKKELKTLQDQKVSLQKKLKEVHREQEARRKLFLEQKTVDLKRKSHKSSFWQKLKQFFRYR